MARAGQPVAGGDSAVAEFGRVDILVNNAAFQRTHDKLTDFTAKAAARHMKPGASIINIMSDNVGMC